MYHVLKYLFVGLDYTIDFLNFAGVRVYPRACGYPRIMGMGIICTHGRLWVRVRAWVLTRGCGSSKSVSVWILPIAIYKKGYEKRQRKRRT